MFNKTVLMSGVDWFDDTAAINPFMDESVAIDLRKAHAEHSAIRQALESNGVQVVQVAPPEGCQDGVYTANWALVRGGTAVMARLPQARKGEEAYAAAALRKLGKEVVFVPEVLKFSGQGDALPCGTYLLAGSGYRSDAEVHRFVANTLGYKVLTLRAVPQTDEHGTPVINRSSGYPDSFFYDIDLAIAVLRPPTQDCKGLIAWCPDAFVPESQAQLRAFDAVEKIEVSLDEAKTAFACNLVSTGETVIMSARAPQLRSALEQRGLQVVTLAISELAKGGGFIRCTTLTLDNA